MDAIAHCMETFMAAAFNPPADGIALDGLERGWAHIERATRDGSDREARLNLMSASCRAPWPSRRAWAACIQPEPQPGRREPALHHGTLNAMFLPAVVRFNARPNRCSQSAAWSAWPAPWAWPAATTSPRPSAT
jgi:4-hydroxybutyrate dehydrogenase